MDPTTGTDEKIHVTDGKRNPVVQSVTRQFTEVSGIITDTLL
jgi:hypothetical protein